MVIGTVILVSPFGFFPHKDFFKTLFGFSIVIPLTILDEGYLCVRKFITQLDIYIFITELDNYIFITQLDIYIFITQLDIYIFIT